MKIVHKLILGSLVLLSLSWAVGLYAGAASRKALQTGIENASVQQATEAMAELDRAIDNAIENWRVYLANPAVRRALRTSNQQFAAMPDAQAYIDQQDHDWRTAPNGRRTPLMQELQNAELSLALSKKLGVLQHRRGYPVYGEVFLTNAYGANIAQTSPTTDYRQDDERWWQRAKEDGLYVGDVKHDESADAYTMDICLRADDNDGTFLGVVMAGLNAETVFSILHTRAAGPSVEWTAPGRSSLTLLTADKREIFCSDHDFGGLADRLHDFAAVRPSAAACAQTYTKRHQELGELIGACAFSKGHGEYKGLGWMVAVENRVQDSLAPAAVLRNRILVISAVVTVVGLVLGTGFSLSLAKRVAKLRDTAARIGAGDLDAQITDQSADEIGQLATRFNQMALELKRRTEAMRHGEEHLQAILDGIRVGVVVINAERHTIVEANPAAVSMVGATRDEIVGHECHKFICPAERGRCPVTDLGQEIDCTERTLLRADGDTVPILKTATPIVLNGQEHLLETFVDIRDRKQMEEELRDGNAMMVDAFEREKRVSQDLEITMDQLEAAKESADAANASLADKLEEVETFNRLAIGRELRMIELKREINDLLTEQGQPPKYKIAELETAT